MITVIKLTCNSAGEMHLISHKLKHSTLIWRAKDKCLSMEVVPTLFTTGMCQQICRCSKIACLADWIL